MHSAYCNVEQPESVTIAAAQRANVTSDQKAETVASLRSRSSVVPIDIALATPNNAENTAMIEAIRMPIILNAVMLA